MIPVLSQSRGRRRPVVANAPTPDFIWWKTDEGTGLSLADSSGNGYTGTLNSNGTNYPSWTTDHLGNPNQALHFYGSGACDVSTDPIQGPQTACTFGCWINPAASQLGLVMAMWSGDFPYMQFIQNGLGLHFRIHQSAAPAIWIGRSVASALTAGVWQWVGGVWHGGNTSSSIDIYVETSKVDTSNDESGSFTAPNSASINFRWGNQGGTAVPFVGDMTQLKGFTTGLSAAQIAAIQ